MEQLSLGPEELLATTRSVRRRLDFSRPVEHEVLEACLRLAQQAPSGSNQQNWHFLVVTDAEKRAALGELYREGARAYAASASSPANRSIPDPDVRATYERVRRSADYLTEHIHDVPVHVIPCIRGRPDDLPAGSQAALWGSILPAAWNFMLAARLYGLGTCWTTFHLRDEEAAARILGIPYEQYTQAALIPVAYSIGTDFKPAPRAPLGNMVHWETW